MPRPMNQSRAGRLGQLENEAPVDPIREAITNMKQVQAELKAKEILRKRKLEEEKKRKSSSQQLAAQLAEYRREQRFLNDPSVPRPASPVPRPATFVPRPATSVPRPATSVPRPATSVPRPATSVPRPAMSMPRPATSVPRPATSVPRPATSVPRPAMSMPRPATSVPRPATSLLRFATSLPQPAAPMPRFRNLSTVWSDSVISPLPFLSSLREFPFLARPRSVTPPVVTPPVVTPPVVTPPGVSQLKFLNYRAVRDEMLSTPLFGNSESDDSVTIENSDISDEDGNNTCTDSDYTDTGDDVPRRKRAKKTPTARKPNVKKPNPKKLNAKKPNAKKPNAKKTKPSDTECCEKTTNYKCTFCSKSFKSQGAFNGHVTRMHKDMPPAEGGASGSANRPKGPEKKKRSQNPRNVVNITITSS